MIPLVIRPDNIFSDVESLKHGIVKTSNNQENEPYTILLLGETGVGKSSFVEFIINVLFGNDIDDYVFDILNEHGGTKSARLHEITSKNGMVVSAGIFERGEYAYPPSKVRILDTPGFAYTRHPQQDALQSESMATHIKGYISSVTAVLVLASGTAPHGVGSLQSAISILSTIFPDAMDNRVAFIFTNVSSPLSPNFYRDTIPAVLKDAPHFVIDNPIALQRKYSWLKGDPNMKNSVVETCAVVDGNQNALEMLVDFFDWLDGLGQQPVPQVDSFCERGRNIKTSTAKLRALIPMGDPAATKAEGSSTTVSC